MRSEVVTAVKIKIRTFWTKISCRCVGGYQHCTETCHVQLQAASLARKVDRTTQHRKSAHHIPYITITITSNSAHQMNSIHKKYVSSSQISSVSIATKYRLYSLGFKSQQGQEIFLLSKTSRPALGTTQPYIQWALAYVLRIKTPGCENQLVPRLKMGGAIPLLPLYFTFNKYLLYKHFLN